MSVVERGIEGVHRLADFEPLARAVMDPGGFDYVAGGAWDELSLGENEAAWLRYRFRPRVMVDVSVADPSTTILGVRSPLPMAIAPTAFHSLAHPDGELETFRGAAAAGVPFILSTSSSRLLEDVAAAAPEATRWFQLYLQDVTGLSESLVKRAEAAGFSAIVLTVDLAAFGYRERDRRSGFQPPPYGNLDPDTPSPIRTRATTTWSVIEEIRGWTSLPVVVKGVLTGEDAELAVEHGANGIVVSNHGARQLDRTPAPIDVLAEVVAAVRAAGAADRTEVWVDGGVRRGLDIAIALGLGARAVLVGRPIVYAVAAGGQAGVERAIAILLEEFDIAMRLLGATTPDGITRAHLAG
jgi:isopentenyl diphosphate isomerase/L-lactate dehydrogenase-like FMN-dependent dehydrogenase